MSTRYKMAQGKEMPKSPTQQQSMWDNMQEDRNNWRSKAGKEMREKPVYPKPMEHKKNKNLGS
jgi:hypothetical protein